MSRPAVFNPGAKAFSIDNAYLLAVAAQAAYSVHGVDAGADAAAVVTAMAGSWKPLTGVDTFLSPAEFNFPTPITGFVAGTDDAVVLSFRGTANLPGWLTDFNVVQIPDPDTAKTTPGALPMVHRGFKTGLDAVWDRVAASVQRKLTGGKTFWITGHSLGAALATLAANRFATRMPTLSVAGVYSFGSPRVGNDDFFSGFRPVYYRFVNNDDIVPHVPLANVLSPAEPPSVPWSLSGAATELKNLLKLQHFTYVHVGSLKYMNRNRQLGEGTSNQESKELQILDVLEQLGQPPERSITDHFIANYVQAVQDNL